MKPAPPVTRTRMVRNPTEGSAMSGLAPDLLGGPDDGAQPGDHLLPGEVVALDRRGEPALRGEAQLVEVDELRGLVDTALEVVLALPHRAVGGEQRQTPHLR